MNYKKLADTRIHHKLESKKYDDSISSEVIMEDISKRNGCFSLIVETPAFIMLATDTITSDPLFYSVNGDVIYVADHAGTVAREINSNLQEVSVNEYLLSGYVQNERTLYEGVYTILPGTAVIINRETGTIKKQRYLPLRYKLQEQERAVDDLVEEAEKVYTDIFEEMLNRIGDRPIAIPLSGGWDSRTIAYYMNKLGAKKVKCFSLGKASSFEIRKSREVAEKLGFEWKCVIYNGEVWKRFYESTDFMTYLEEGCHGNTLANVQHLPALMCLREEGFLDENSVVVPGHCLDFISSAHFSRDVSAYSAQEMTEYVMRKHYHLRHVGGGIKDTDIRRCLHEIFSEQGHPIAICAAWERDNRQSKFIANEVRAYEHVGLDYELPFWHKRSMAFWEDVPLDLLLGRNLQGYWIREKINPFIGILEPPESKFNNAGDLKQTLRKAFPNLLRMKKNITWRKYLMRQDVNAFYECFTTEELRDLRKKFGTGWFINGWIADRYINVARNRGEEIHGNYE